MTNIFMKELTIAYTVSPLLRNSLEMDYEITQVEDCNKSFTDLQENRTL